MGPGKFYIIHMVALVSCWAVLVLIGNPRDSAETRGIVSLSSVAGDRPNKVRWGGASQGQPLRACVTVDLLICLFVTDTFKVCVIANNQKLHVLIMEPLCF